MIYVNEQLNRLAQMFEDAGYILYITGGYVRDCLRSGGAVKTDIDICAGAGAAEVERILSGSAYRIKDRNSSLGTVAVVAEDNEVYEYTAFRRDSYRGGTHKPAKVEFVGTVQEDALRRDFTVNSIYYDISGGKLTDPTGGVKDLEKRILRTSDKPEITFGSDGLRLMRLARFACTLDFEIEKQTLAAAKNMAGLIKDITHPRINEEFFKILNAEDGAVAYRGLRLLKDIGLLFYITPELQISDDFPQSQKWHEYDVLEHIFRTVELCRPEIRMAGLLHDIGKPYSERQYGNSYHHTEIALELAPKILKEFGYSGRRSARILRLIEHHMYDLDSDTGRNKVKKFILKNQDILEDLLDLKQADYLASGKHGDICPTVTKWRDIYGELSAGPMNVKDLNITAEQLIAGLRGVMPQSDTGTVLQKLLAACATEGVANEYDSLLKRARSYYL